MHAEPCVFAADIHGELRITTVNADCPGVALFVIGTQRAQWLPVVKALSEGASLHPIHCLSLAEGAAAPRTVHGIAQRLTAGVLGLAPQGAPVHVLGLGRAGPLAYEVALQCAARDRVPCFVGVVDEAMFIGLEDVHGDASLALPQGEDLGLALGHYEMEPMGLPVHWLHRRARSGGQSPFPPDPAWKGLRSAGLFVACPSLDPDESLANQLARVQSKAMTRVPSAISAVYEASSLVTIQRGRAGDAPHVCIPGAGAGIMDFMELAAAVGKDRLIHGLQARGMSGDAIPIGCVEVAARRHVAEVDRIHPQGDLHLVGHSFGGWIAFEMALLWQRAGRHVSSLILLDSEPPGAPARSGREYTRAEALLELTSLYGEVANQPLGIRLADLQGLGYAEQLALVHGRLVHLGLLPKRSEPEQLSGSVRCFETALRTHYLPRERYEGAAFLFQAEHRGKALDAPASSRETAEQWQHHAPNLMWRTLPCGHVRLLKRPFITDVMNGVQHLTRSDEQAWKGFGMSLAENRLVVSDACP